MQFMDGLVLVAMSDNIPEVSAEAAEVREFSSFILNRYRQFCQFVVILSTLSSFSASDVRWCPIFECSFLSSML